MKSDIAETVESVYNRMIGGGGADDVAVRVSDGIDRALSEVSVNEPVEQPANGGDRKRKIDDPTQTLTSPEKKISGGEHRDEEEDPDLPPGFG